MMATSHALSGAAIAIAVKEPMLALPLAFVSHFALDILPHIGFDEFGGHLKKKVLFHRILKLDALLLALFMAYLILNSAGMLVIACVVLAGSPDAIWAYRYVFQEKFGQRKPRPKSLFSRFHSKIQWSQTLKGSFVEVPFTFLLLVFVIMNI